MKKTIAIVLFTFPFEIALASEIWLEKQSKLTTKKILAEVTSTQERQNELLKVQIKINYLRTNIAAENDLTKKKELLKELSRLEKSYNESISAPQPVIKKIELP